ncbi:MAG TPA: ATP-binding protein [Solirubrobacteraceae bacterium]|nr:ATP-binding protein [Solirubrobacteraceae bacterium]
MILGLSLRCDRRAPRLARRALEDALDADPVLDDARLVTSELVNNAVLHSGCEADDIMRVMVRLDAGYLVISVHVPGVSPTPGDAAHSALDFETGRLGLRVVEHLADRWGTESPDDHRLWAALPLGATG